MLGGYLIFLITFAFNFLEILAAKGLVILFLKHGFLEGSLTSS
jgi:hypothetical protein